MPPRVNIDKEELIKLRKKGLTYEEIGEEFGVTQHTIYRKFKEKDIDPRHSLRSSKVNDMNELDKSYIAGIIDGEGCVGLAKQVKELKDGSESIVIRPQIRVGMTDKETVEHVGKKVGSGSFSFQYEEDDTKKEQEIFVINAINDVIDFIEQIKPYMITKKKQSELLLEYCKSRKPRTEYTERQLEIYDELRELNKRGV